MLNAPRIILIALLLGLVGGAQAGRITHGLNTTWSPGLFGGGWVCFASLVTGCSQAFNATCDGVADDTSADTAFRAYAAANTDVKLYIPPGSSCNITFDGTFSFTSGAHNLIVWAYGVTFNNLALGGLQAFFQDNTHQALIADASLGDTSVTVTDGNIARFTVGHWIAVTGLSLQDGGTSYPPNFAFFEYRQITGIAGNVVSLDSPLINSYKSTWPVVNSGTPSAGPATIFDLDQTWDTSLQWYGGTVTSSTPGQQINMLGRNVTFNNVNWLGTLGADATVSKNWTCNNCLFNGGMEIDKDSENLTFNYVTTGQISNVSMNRNITFNNVRTINGGSLNGTGRFMTIVNGSELAGGASVGVSGFGHSETLTLNGSNLGSFQCSTQAAQTNWFSYSAGVFSITNTDPNLGRVLAWAIPGYQYFFATTNPIVNLGSAFTITNVTQDATNTHITTDIIGALPSLGQTHYVAQPAPTVTASTMIGSSTPTNATGAWCHL